MLLISDPKGTFNGRVTATAHSRVHRVGTGLRAFSEQVTLRADGPGIDHLPFAVRSLLIGDLPTNLWWASHQPPPLAGPILYDLSEHADQVIYDSFGWPEPARGMSATASWLDKFERGPHEGRYRVASDLTWRRLKDWRRIILQAIEPSTVAGSCETVTELAFEHGVHSVMAAWSLASWLTFRLGWRMTGVRVQPGIEIHWMFTSPQRRSTRPHQTSRRRAERRPLAPNRRDGRRLGELDRARHQTRERRPPTGDHLRKS